MLNQKHACKGLKEILSELDSFHTRKWELRNGRKIEEWWPISGKFSPPELEIVIGAILTQNTNWKNVEKALLNLIEEDMTSAEKIANADIRKLQKILKSAGFFTQKAARLKTLSRFIIEYEGDFFSGVKREELLKLKGIGRETADSILLFACGKPNFVVDAYTMRIFSRHGIIPEDMKYEEACMFFENNIKGNAELYKKWHALIVEHAKEFCRKKKNCEGCPLSSRK